MSANEWGIFLSVTLAALGGVLGVFAWGYSQIGSRLKAKVNAEKCDAVHDAVDATLQRVEKTLEAQGKTLTRVDRRLLVITTKLGIKEDDNENNSD